MALVHEGMAQHGLAVLAGLQTSGKGQRNKSWLSAQNQNLLCSIVIQPNLHLRDAFILSMATAIAVRDLFNKYAGSETRIKWPNDIYWRDRKAGGILIENVLQGSYWKYAVIGIGLNINQTDFGSELQRAVSLKQVTGKEWKLPGIANELFSSMENVLHFLEEQGAAAIIETYHTHLFRLHENIRLKKGGREFPALLKSVGRDGFLVVETNTEERFKAGEIEWLI